MTREETKKILMGISCSYPNFKPNVPFDFLIEVWTDDLAEYSYEQVYMALKTFKATDVSGFAPSVGQIINKIAELKEQSNPDKTLSDGEAWALVMKAIRNSTYNSAEEYEKLDEISKRVIGSPESLRSMAMNEDFNEGVEKSLFVRTYKQLADKQKQFSKIPVDIRTAIEQKKNERIGIENGKTV